MIRNLFNKWPPLKGAIIGVLAVFMLSLLTQTFFAVNVSPSLPEWGWLRVPFTADSTSAFKIGDKVEFQPNFETGKQSEAQSPALGSVKIIMGLPGDRIIIQGGVVSIEGRYIGPLQATTSTGTALEPIKQGVIPAGKMFMAATHDRSFDSRYASFGFISPTSITAKVYALPDIPFLGLDAPFLSEEEWIEIINSTPATEQTDLSEQNFTDPLNVIGRVGIIEANLSAKLANSTRMEITKATHLSPPDNMSAMERRSLVALFGTDLTALMSLMARLGEATNDAAMKDYIDARMELQMRHAHQPFNLPTFHPHSSKRPFKAPQSKEQQ